MPQPRKRVFGPLFYSTLAVAVLILGFFGASNLQSSFSDWNAHQMLLQRLKGPNPGERAAAATTLAQEDPKISLPIFLEMTQDSRVEIRETAYRFFAHLWVEPRVVIPKLLDATEDPQVPIRYEATRSLALVLQRARQSVQSPPAASGGVDPHLRARCLEVLRARLADQEGSVRGEAIRGLESFGRDPEVAKIFAGLISDPERSVQFAAASALLRVGEPENRLAVQTLLKLLVDPEPVADRRAIFDVLQTLSDPVRDEASGALASLLKTVEPAVRPDVVECLTSAGAGARVALPELEALWKDEQDPSLQSMAGAAIVAIEGHENPRSQHVLLVMVMGAGFSRDQRVQAFEELRQSNPNSLSAASSQWILQLTDANPAVRRTALELLGMSIDDFPASLPQLDPKK